MFQQKYRIESARLKAWDYAGAGWYFITVCTRNRACLLGQVDVGDVRLSASGEIVAEEWQRTAAVRPQIVLDEWVVMPNHLHGIIGILPHEDKPATTGLDTQQRVAAGRSRLASGSLGTIVGQFKSVCTKRIWAAGAREFGWQPRFFDHVIRDEAGLRMIRQYILQNPLRWEVDQRRPENLWT